MIFFKRHSEVEKCNKAVIQKTTGIDVKMIMQVHDELVFEVADKDVKAAIPHIKSYMENVIALDVPILVHVGVGDNWDEAH